MNQVFADTSYFVALFNPRDQLHLSAVEIETVSGAMDLVTSDLVLIETLNYFSEFPKHIKQQVADSVEYILDDPEIIVVRFSAKVFSAAFKHYRHRLDHGYSLTDCSSMIIMREKNISEFVTNEDHFKQEGFRILL